MAKIITPPAGKEGWVSALTAREMDDPIFMARMAQAQEGLVKIAEVRKLGVGVEVQMRPLMPEDVGLGANQRWLTAALTGAGTWDQYLNRQNTSAQAVAIFGFFNRSANQQVINFRYGSGSAGAGGVKIHFNFEQARAEEQAVMYHTPVFYEPDEFVQTAVMAEAAVTQQCGYIGLIIEKAGEVTKGVYV